MRIEFVGHACFRIRLNSDRTLLIDPYQGAGFGGRLKYRPIETSPSLVLITHDHPDHSDLSWVSGSPRVVRTDWQDEDVAVRVHRVDHDEFGGNLRGEPVAMMSIRAEGIHVLHCGDLGERLLPERTRQLGPVDVLLVPVGGYYTIGPEAAAELIRQILPRYAVPFHYRTDACALEAMLPLERFLRRFENSRWPGHITRTDVLDPSQQTEGGPVIAVLSPIASVSSQDTRSHQETPSV